MENLKTIQEVGKRIISVDDLLNLHNISLNEWEIVKKEVNSWENVSKGPDNKPIVTPLHQVKLTLKRTTHVEDLKQVRKEFIDDLKKISPKVKKPIFSRNTSGDKLFQINLFDLHLGKMSWHEETGWEYNLETAIGLFNRSIDHFMGEASGHKLDKILLPIGNDFFNSDRSHPYNSTTSGTPQDESNMWQEVFREGRKAIVTKVQELSKIAPVHILMIPGNHDWEKNFYLGDSLEGWFWNNENVHVDNSPNPRKYFYWNGVLIGFTHGNNEKVSDLPLIMAQESPYWSTATWKEFHIGHWHQKKDLKFSHMNEFTGVSVKYMSSLASTDSWHHKKGYIGRKSAEALLWDSDNGLFANFHFNDIYNKK